MMGMSKPKKETELKIDAAQAESLFAQFEIGLARAVSTADSKKIEALHMLGHALTRAGRHQEALEVDLKLASLRPKDPVVFYNLACSYAQLENLDAAFEALHRAFELGYNDYRHMLRDPDLRNVRKDGRFKALLDKKWGKRQP